MSNILANPLYQASMLIENKIINGVDENLSTLGPDYVPAEKDKDLFLPYANEYVLMNVFNYFHPQLFFDFGNKVLEKVSEHEQRIGKSICKESVFAIMAMCSIGKNDVLNYRIYLEKMLQQRSVYLVAPTSLIDLINNEPVFGLAKRESNRVFDENKVIDKLKKSLFPDLNFTNVCLLLSSFHQKQFVTYILNYRVLHYSLSNPECPDIVFENCYSLIQGLCVLVESYLKEAKASTKLLWPLLSSEISEPFKSILITRLDLKNRFKTHDIASFNSNLPSIITELETKSDADEIICYHLYIAYMCRNQVLHNVTDGAIFHGDGILTEKLIGILISAIFFVSKV